MSRNLLVLPPGVLLPPPPPPAGPQPGSPPFNRDFFERILPEVAAAFCERAACDSVIVELITTDGATHLVKGISALSEQWVALQLASTEYDHEIDSFIPYQAIYRLELHPRLAREPRRLGYLGTLGRGAPPALLPPGPEIIEVPASTELGRDGGKHGDGDKPPANE